MGLSAKNRFRRDLGRFSALATVLATIFVLYLTVSSSKSTISCRKLPWCTFGPPRYEHKVPENLVAVESEEVLRDGTQTYTRELNGTKPETLFLVLTRDSGSWSHDFLSSSRTVRDFFNLLVSTELDLTTVSFSMMTSSQDEYDEAKRVAAETAAEIPLARVTIYHQEDKGPSFPYELRHDPAIQRQRRVKIAALRNILMLRALRDEDHVIWVDADVVEFSKHIVQTMIGHSTTTKDAGVMTALCEWRGGDYDENAWKLDRDNQTLMAPVADEDMEKTAQLLVDTRTLVHKLIEGTSDDDIIPLDSVGGTILYMRAGLIRQGLNFPTQYVVGTTWSHEGWFGIESEGVCYMAGNLDGGKCYVLGGSHHVRHADRA